MTLSVGFGIPSRPATGPVAELDHALTYAAARLHSARASGDAEDRVLHLWDPTNQIEQIDTGGLT